MSNEIWKAGAEVAIELQLRDWAPGKKALRPPCSRGFTFETVGRSRRPPRCGSPSSPNASGGGTPCGESRQLPAASASRPFEAALGRRSRPWPPTVAAILSPRIFGAPAVLNCGPRSTPSGDCRGNPADSLKRGRGQLELSAHDPHRLRVFPQQGRPRAGVIDPRDRQHRVLADPITANEVRDAHAVPACLCHRYP